MTVVITLSERKWMQQKRSAMLIMLSVYAATRGGLQMSERAVGQIGADKNLKIKNKSSKDKSTKIRVTLPYVRGVSEDLSKVYGRHGMAMLMKPHATIKRMLVHPKHKYILLENTGAV